MFADNSYTPTFTGPIYASGEALRRSRNTAMAQSEFGANQRGLVPRDIRRGIQAGSASQKYLGGLFSDAERSTGLANAQQLLAENAMQNAGAALAYQGNQSREQASIRDALLDRDRIAQNSELDLRELQKQVQAQRRQRQVETEIANRERRSRLGGLLMGLFGA